MNHTIDALELLPYQADFAANTARFKIGLWARQTGKDHTAAAEAVLDCFHNPGATWIIVAASERQALESLAKARECAHIIKLGIDEYNEAPGNVPCSVARISSTEIKWSNGSRLIALPASPSTIRGYSANLILTEFAFHENPDALWRAIYPTISNPLRGGPKKLRIISTPNGLNNKFAHLWHTNAPNPVNLVNPVKNLNPPSAYSAYSAVTSPSPIPNENCSMLDAQCDPNPNPVNPVNPVKNPSPSSCSSFPSVESSSSVLSVPPVSVPSVLLPSSPLFHTSKITIHDAIRAGLPLDPAELQAALNDPEAWAQEYLCEFADNSSVLLPYDLIESCESSLATELSSLEALSASALPNHGRPYLIAGLDFARKNHLTVCWILERLPASVGTSCRSSGPLDGGTARAASGLDAQCNSPTALSASSAPSALDSPSSSSPSYHSPLTPNHFLLTREVLTLRNLSTPEQLELLTPRLRHCERVCLDYTGPGIGLGDHLQRQLGSGRLELCPFTSSFKAELFPRLVAAFESRELLIPIGRDIREDLHSIYRTTTNSGNILYRAHSTTDGHADRTTALALALRAAHTAPPRACATIVGRPIPHFAGRYRHSMYRPLHRTINVFY